MHNENAISQEVMIADDAQLRAVFAAYLEHCDVEEEFPNLAGLCRFCRTGEEGFSRLRGRFPETAGFILAALEDCALNADRPAALVTAYLKHRLGYGEAGGGEGPTIIIDQALTDDGR